MRHTVGPDLVIRPLEPQDHDAVQALHEHLTARDTYLRFFPVAPLHIEGLAEMLCRQDETHVSRGAFVDGALVAVANYTVVTIGLDGSAAEWPSRSATPWSITASEPPCCDAWSTSPSPAVSGTCLPQFSVEDGAGWLNFSAGWSPEACPGCCW